MIIFVLFFIVPIMGHILAHFIISKNKKLKILAIFLMLSLSVSLWYFYDWYFFFITPVVTLCYWYNLTMEKI